MEAGIGVALVLIVVLGIGAEWLAWALRLPSVLVLLIAGFLVGPVFGLLDPAAILGDSLLPLVSVAVAIILFEGSLGLRASELQGAARPLWRLLTIGIGITWIVAAAVSYLVIGLGLEVAVLLGAILVVTGPTVVIPLLLHLRPAGRTGPILKWEGVVLDPIGAVLALLVFEAITAGAVGAAGSAVVSALVSTALLGAILGGFGAYLVVFSLRRYWLPDHLHSPLALAVALGAYALANVFQPDSGLLAVTVMGVLLANQKTVSIAHIVAFKENLRVLLISSLFIILAARVELNSLAMYAMRGGVLLAALVLVARPLSVMIATRGSGLSSREKVFMALLAPRGIVAASVAAVFALELEGIGVPGAEAMVPISFLVVAGTVLVYGLAAPLAAHRTGIAESNPQGVLFVGADAWVREIASTLQDQGVKVMVVDSSWPRLSAARMLGLRAVYANVLSQYALNKMDLGGMGRLIAMTDVDEYNSLAVRHFASVFGRGEVYQLAPDAWHSSRGKISPRLVGRVLVGYDWSLSRFSRLYERGATTKVTCLTEAFDDTAFREYYGDAAIPLFVVDPSGRLQIVADGAQVKARPGQCIVSIVDPDRPIPGMVQNSN